MLVLTRKRNESIVINDVIRVTVVDIRGDKVRLGIEAPRDISVHRQEVYELIQRQLEQKRQAESTAGEEQAKDGADQAQDSSEQPASPETASSSDSTTSSPPVSS